MNRMQALHVTFGAAVAFGVDLERFFDEVHRSSIAELLASREVLR